MDLIKSFDALSGGQPHFDLVSSELLKLNRIEYQGAGLRAIG